MAEYEPAKHDVIYLQPDEFPETTWCADKINENDIKYLRATPNREAADELYEALKSRHRYEVNRYWHRPRKPKKFWVRYEQLIHGKERAALALADGDGGE